MSDSIQECLARLRDDYAQVEGKPFKHFFCPILWADEDTELCMGHVVNKAFADARIVQRKDVDNFYGSIAEAEFQSFLECRDKPIEEIVSDPKLLKEIQPTVDGKKVEVYPFVGHKPPDHTRVRFEGPSGNSTDLVLKMCPKEAAAAQNTALGVDWDCTSPGLASLIKAAHLTMFCLMGYRYALSAAGEYVGRQILGRFYLENRGKHGKQVKEAAQTYFPQFVNMVKPIYGTNMKGTVADNRLHLFRESSGKSYGMGVLVRVDKRLFQVLVPVVSGDADTVATYLEALGHDSESLVDVYHFNKKTGRCEFSFRGVQLALPENDSKPHGS